MVRATMRLHDPASQLLGPRARRCIMSCHVLAAAAAETTCSCCCHAHSNMLPPYRAAPSVCASHLASPLPASFKLGAWALTIASLHCTAGAVCARTPLPAPGAGCLPRPADGAQLLGGTGGQPQLDPRPADGREDPKGEPVRRASSQGLLRGWVDWGGRARERGKEGRWGRTPLQRTFSCL